MQKNTLRLLLGDQLNENHSWFNQINPHVHYVLMEIRSETDYVQHHIQKIAAIFGSMRQFAQHLKAEGHKVHYIKISDSKNQHRFADNLKAIIQTEKIARFEYQAPDEYRVDEHLKSFCQSIQIESEMFDSEHFLTSRNDLAQIFEGKKTYLMATFYRKIRTKYHIMMENGKPVGDQWSFDHDNRNKYRGEIPIPIPEVPENDVTEIIQEINASGVKYIGTIEEQKMIWPINKAQSINMLAHFCEHALPAFGTYQDAMLKTHWTLFHSRLSFSMNVKMLHPLEVVSAAVNEWKKRPEEISLPQIEGFVRQIVGWREYMRGVYWAHMPDYASKNYFNHTEKLPNWFWTGETKMNCLQKTIQQSLTKAYAHHIQRLMITGNFALLAGVAPDEVDAWYLGIYIDAFEWVEITNTRGMSQFADGGLVGTKPYVSSANYIDKMSDYCSGCFYDKKVKHGPKACPFNSLYWHFYARNKDKLERNPRIGMMYRTWEKMDSTEKDKILNQADTYLNKINDL